ncbi:MAG: OmpA family protein [Dysgonamonadaceae bacterium]|jgi:outer membrane protein OmpA-like peptidoglycan-associated protein|nr:OmpA family protein [Dysgonamonadaceae bacterium]
MKRLATFIILLSAIFLPALAQEEISLAEAITRSTKSDNWFIAVGGNANLLFAEQDRLVNPLKRITYGGDFSIGKWFNPYTGVRINGTYGALMGWNSYAGKGGTYLGNDNYRSPHGTYPGIPITGQYSALPSFDLKDHSRSDWHGFQQDFNYGALTLDILANLSNYFYGHYSDRRVNIVPFAGLGLIASFKGKNNTYLNYPGHLVRDSWYWAVVKIGFTVDVRLTKNFSVYLEPSAYATNIDFDAYEGHAWGDAVVKLSLGVKYTFNPGFHDIGKITLNEIDRLNEKINENRRRIDEHQEILDHHENLLEKLQKCCEEKPVVIVDNISKNKVDLPFYIHFKLDSYKVEESEYRKLLDLVEYINDNSDSDILLVGYADRQTGSPKYNLNLSKKRVYAVAKELNEKGISSDRLELQWKGDTEQPFAENESNRAVIIVEQK